VFIIKNIIKKEEYLFYILAALVYLVEYIEWSFPPGNVWDYDLDVIWNIQLLIYMMGGVSVAASVNAGSKLYDNKRFLVVMICLIILDTYILDRLLYRAKHYLSLIILGSHVYLLCCSLFKTLAVRGGRRR